MQIDGGVPIQLAAVPESVRRLERRGYAAGWCGELNHDPFLPLVLAAEHTSTLQVGTCIAVAFARNPMTVANLGWDLQTYSEGRFVLGLGSQIQPHVEKRFSMPWGWPVERMRSSSSPSAPSGQRGRTARPCASRATSTPTRS